MHKLKYSDLEDFRDLISEAFVKDPLFISLTDNIKNRKNVSFLIFQLMLELGDGEIEMYSPTSKKEGIAIWENQNKKQKKEISKGKLLKEIYNEIGFKGILKLVWYGFILSKNTSYLNKQSDYKLNILAVDPKFKGQGFASKLIKPMLEKFDEEGLVCLLDTNNPINLNIYQHLGFKLEKTTYANSFLKGFYMLRTPLLSN